MNVIVLVLTSAAITMTALLWLILAAITGGLAEVAYDPGGYIGARAAQIAADEPVRIVGYCASAC